MTEYPYQLSIEKNVKIKYCFCSHYVYKRIMLKKIGKEWKHKKQGGCFSSDHLSPSQLNKNIDQWFFDYCVLDEKDRKAIPPNLKMIFGGLAGQAMQDMITENLTLNQVMKGKDA
jgi:hypothetical protein